jgi:hypothetical protein
MGVAEDLKNDLPAAMSMAAFCWRGLVHLCRAQCAVMVLVPAEEGSVFLGMLRWHAGSSDTTTPHCMEPLHALVESNWSLS